MAHLAGENTTGGAAKVHQPCSKRRVVMRLTNNWSYAKHGQPSDRRTLRAQLSLCQRTTGRSSTNHQRTRCAGSSPPFAVPPRALNELPDQGIEAPIDLIMLFEEKCKWPDLCNRFVFIAKAGVVRPIGLLFAIVRVPCKLRRIEAKMWEASFAEGFSGPRRRVASSGVSGSRQHGVNG